MHQVGWHSFGQDALSFPLAPGRTSATTREEYHREYRRAADVFASQWSDELYGAYVTLLQPYARIEILGTIGPDKRKVRIHAAVRDHIGVLVAQEPGPDTETGGLVHLSRMHAANLAARVVRALPPIPAGPYQPFEAAWSDLTRSDDEYYRPTSWLQSSNGTRTTPAQQMRRLMERPRLAELALGIYPGPDRDPAAKQGGYSWHLLDFADGRLLAHSSRTTLRIEPQDAPALTSLLQRLLTSTLNRYSATLH